MVKNPADIKWGERDGRSVGEIRRSLPQAAMGVPGQGRNPSLPRPRKMIMTMQFGRTSKAS